MQGGALPINAEDLKIIPMPKYDSSKVEEINGLMRKIYQQNIEDEKNLEETYKQIDNIIFKLYNLKPEEIKIVEELYAKSQIDK